MKSLKQIIPFFILFTLTGLLAYEMFYAKPNELPSALVGENVPTFSLPNLYDNAPPLTQKALRGHVTLLNVWATWCDTCSVEHPMLMKIKNEYHVPIYSLVYKDDTRNAIQWLNDNGNPYTLSGNDAKGDVAIDFGVYGTPETFVISPTGKIVYRHIGAIDQQSWDETLYPIIKKLGG